MLEFRVLGPLEVAVDGSALQLGGQKQRALLALLLLNRGLVVSTDRLVDALWGQESPRTATTSLQNFVSHLRKELPAGTLSTRSPGYVLDAEPRQVDVGRFRDLQASARALPPAERAARLREALALWRGEPLAEFAFEAWAQPEIASLEELRLGTLEERVEAELESGAGAELVGELEALVREHPYRERLHGQLMLALYRAGRQAEALEAYAVARRTLVEGLGLEPGPALQRLHGRILRQEGSLAPAAAAPDDDVHLAAVLDALLSGRLVPVLASDVGELARGLARRFDYPGEGELARVSQYVAVMQGVGPLYDELHALLAETPPPTEVHRFFAGLPPLLRERGLQQQLLVTTSYDLALEQAFLEAGEEFDVVVYLATGRHRGRFCHLAPDGTASPIELPNTYATELSLDRRTVILKLHGRVDPTPERAWESFVVTEDDYIDYLARREVSAAIPVGLAAKLRRSHFLFLGATMADWHLRVVLYRLWGEEPPAYRSWAVQPEPLPLERQFWRRRDVDVLEAPLERYVELLARGLQVHA